MAKRTSKNGKKPEGEQPVFDYTNYSRKEQKAFTRKQAKMARLASQIANSTEFFDTEDEFEDAQDEFDRLVEEGEALTMRLIVSVPRDWLTVDAPADLDWDDPASINWIRVDKSRELMDAAGEAQSPESVSGN